MRLKNQTFIQIKDRKLGDEWTGWQGSLDNSEINSDTRKRIFMGVLLFAIFLSGATGFLIWYMITPRLIQFHHLLPLFIGGAMLITWFLFAGWFFLMALSVWLEKDILMRLGGREFSLTFLIPIALKFGLRLGISRDRMSNSFVKVSNTLIRMSAKKVNPEKLLILLPRCLHKSLRDKIESYSELYHIPVFTVAGGEKARQIVIKRRPRAIIGVACERDLLSGIQDIIKQIPVIGIPNKRPEGPCKNTTIDFEEFENAVQTFLNPTAQPTPDS